MICRMKTKGVTRGGGGAGEIEKCKRAYVFAVSIMLVFIVVEVTSPLNLLVNPNCQLPSST